MKRTLIFMTSAIVLFGCSDGMNLNSRGWHFYERYKEAPDYKALAVTPSTFRDALAMGIGHDRISVRTAIQEAMERCKSARARINVSSRCRLHSIGDTNVSAMDEKSLDDAIAQYQAQGNPKGQ